MISAASSHARTSRSSDLAREDGDGAVDHRPHIRLVPDGGPKADEPDGRSGEDEGGHEIPTLVAAFRYVMIPYMTTVEVAIIVAKRP